MHLLNHCNPFPVSCVRHVDARDDKVSEHDPHELKHVRMAELAQGASRKVEAVFANEPCYEDRDRCWRHAAREGRASKVKKVAEAEPRGSRVADHLWRVWEAMMEEVERRQWMDGSDRSGSEREGGGTDAGIRGRMQGRRQEREEELKKKLPCDIVRTDGMQPEARTRSFSFFLLSVAQ